MAQQQETGLGWHMTAGSREIADILTEFAEEIRRGDVVVWKEKDELHIDPTGKIHMSVQAGQNGGSEGLMINLHWQK
jgi:amphi-Trp domain-containing protein